MTDVLDSTREDPDTERRQMLADLLAEAVDDGLFFEDKRLYWADRIVEALGLVGEDTPR